MARAVNVTVKARGTDAAHVREYLLQRLSSRFGKVVHRSVNQQTDAFSGGSISQPYGFKATAAYEQAGPQDTMVTVTGRPTMGLLAYLVLIVFVVLVGFAIAYPLEGAIGLLFALVLIIVSRRGQERVMQDLEKTAADLTARFSA